jgi:Flp pilus assembly protein TadB
MLCRQCGTEIADKALICYRCGAATTEPKFKPPSGTPRQSGFASLVASALALALLVVFALYLGRIATGDVPRLLSWAAVGIALVVFVLRVYARRR